MAKNSAVSRAGAGKVSRRSAGRYWSAAATRSSNALDLDPGVFTWDDPRRIARSLKRSAEKSKRRKSSAFRSAMSMLTFYINRAGRNLPSARRATLDRAKAELRLAFARERKLGPPEADQTGDGAAP